MSEGGAYIMNKKIKILHLITLVGIMFILNLFPLFGPARYSYYLGKSATRIKSKYKLSFSWQLFIITANEVVFFLTSYLIIKNFFNFTVNKLNLIFIVITITSIIANIIFYFLGAINFRKASEPKKRLN